ncbi:sulfatase [Novipirellula sp.]|uniref:sulfatase family protein n=1 Tax=Novipirellula sp. TaxID=2795430 RepID=UPI003562C8D1
MNLRALVVCCFVVHTTICLAEIRNVVFILSDDHRYDFMGFMDEAPDFLETPNLDRMAAGGVHVRNAFVTTSLCSPSRASILTGRYMHAHRVVDNQRPVPPGTRFFPAYLQDAGVKTAFVGKWHMGHDSDERRPGFDHWVSFKGQGEYFDPELNINGDRRQFKGYNADILTDQAIEWIDAQASDEQSKPFFLYLSYKAVHYPFKPAPRHRGRYAESKIKYPETMANSEENYQTQSRWIRDRRYSIHGIDHMETGAFDNDPVPSFDALYRDYCETVHSVDENIGRVLDQLKAAGQLDSTLVLYMGDNGFALGEHGFYDKRDAFEESIRVPMLAYAPTNLPAGKTIDPMIQNIDVASTVLDAMKVAVPEDAKVDGKSFLPLLRGDSVTWRDHILYEYHWEWNFPATPTLFAIRDERFKYVYYHGVWDQNGFYDLQTDPHERHNLIDVPSYREQIERMSRQMFDELSAMGGLNVPVRPPQGERLGSRKLPR